MEFGSFLFLICQQFGVKMEIDWVSKIVYSGNQTKPKYILVIDEIFPIIAKIDFLRISHIE